MIRESLSFTFNNISSSTMGITNINILNGLYKEPIVGEKEIKEIKVRNKDRPIFQSIQYSKPISIDISFSFDNGFTNETLRSVCRWLFDISEYKELTFSSNPNRIFYAMPIGDSNLIHNGANRGYIQLTFRTNSPYSYLSKVTTGIYDYSINPSEYSDDLSSLTATLTDVEIV